MCRQRQTNQVENRAYLRKVQIIGFKEKDEDLLQFFEDRFCL